MRSPLRVLSVTATLAATAALGACGGGTDHDGMTGKGAAGSSAATSTSTRVDPGDVMFAQAMMPHHHQAIEMADIALSQATSAQVKTLAKDIKAAQNPEIATMNGWLDRWGAAAGSADMGGMDHGSGSMMSQADMTRLRQASGAEFDRMWLTMMLAHHQGALTMAKDALATTTDPGVRALAQSVIDGQTTEIATMNDLLRNS